MMIDEQGYVPHAIYSGGGECPCPGSGSVYHRWFQAGRDRGWFEARASGLDIGWLRSAIYTVSLRHDWEHTSDREDRTEEIAAEYLRLSGGAAR